MPDAPARVGENGWHEWSRHVLHELQAIRDAQAVHEEKQDHILDRMRSEWNARLDQHIADGNARWERQEAHNKELEKLRWQMIGGGTVLIWLASNFDKIMGLFK